MLLYFYTILAMYLNTNDVCVQEFLNYARSVFSWVPLGVVSPIGLRRLYFRPVNAVYFKIKHIVIKTIHTWSLIPVNKTNIVCQVDRSICLGKKKEEWGHSQVTGFYFRNSFPDDCEVLCLLGWTPQVPDALCGIMTTSILGCMFCIAPYWIGLQRNSAHRCLLVKWCKISKKKNPSWTDCWTW